MLHGVVKRCSLLLCLAVMGCATGPKFSAEGVDAAITPQYAAANIDATRERHVIWGGLILTSANLKDRSQIEVLSYPLDSDQRPNVGVQPGGRFLIVQDGYLETADYFPGRVISVRGTVKTTQTGQVGEVSYTYPVVQPQEIYLWRRDGSRVEPSVHFGVGISISR